MRSLFDYERKRQLAWLAEASVVDRVAPLNTLVPPRDSVAYGAMGPGDAFATDAAHDGAPSDLYNAAAMTPSPGGGASLPLVDGTSPISRKTVPDISVLVTEEHSLEDALPSAATSAPKRSTPPPLPSPAPSGAGFLVAGTVLGIVTALLVAAAIVAGLLWKP